MKNKLHLIVIAAVLVGAGLWAELASAQKSTSQAWDYKIMWVDFSYGTPTWNEDGRGIPGPVSMLKKSKELGAQGWELVAFRNAGSNGEEYWYKRLK